jgi:hypothetical protein
MERIIKTFPTKKQREIYDAHYSVIGKEYLRCRDIKGCIKWTQKTSKPLYFYIKHGKDAIQSFVKPRNKA